MKVNFESKQGFNEFYKFNGEYLINVGVYTTALRDCEITTTEKGTFFMLKLQAIQCPDGDESYPIFNYIIDINQKGKWFKQKVNCLAWILHASGLDRELVKAEILTSRLDKQDICDVLNERTNVDTWEEIKEVINQNSSIEPTKKIVGIFEINKDGYDNLKTVLMEFQYSGYEATNTKDCIFD